jgi:hypothetical protein
MIRLSLLLTMDARPAILFRVRSTTAERVHAMAYYGIRTLPVYSWKGFWQQYGHSIRCVVAVDVSFVLSLLSSSPL